MEKLLNIIFPKYLANKIIDYVPKKKPYTCLYCGHIYNEKDIKFNDPNNCPCYYQWIYFHQSDYREY